MSETYDPNSADSSLDLKQHPGLLETDQVLVSSDRRLVLNDYASRNGIDDIGLQNNMAAVHNSLPNESPRSNALPRSFSRDSPLNLCTSGYSGLAMAQTKLDSLKTWSISTYKCTRQALQEKLGKVTRTVDVELEQSIDALRDVQTRYNNILIMTKSMAAHFGNMLQSQMLLADGFLEIADKEMDLKDDFRHNAEMQRVVAKNGEKLLAVLNFFASTLQTLCEKTIEDTILTIRNFENSRLEYDANKHDLEQLQQSQIRTGDFQHRLHEVEQAVQDQKTRYEQLREDVQVKMKFLHENKVKVMQKQLLLLHNATSAFFAGNNAVLEGTLKQFSVKNKMPTSSKSWLEG